MQDTNEALPSPEQAQDQLLVNETTSVPEVDSADAPAAPTTNTINASVTQGEGTEATILQDDVSLAQLAQQSEDTLRGLWSEIGLSEDEKTEELGNVRRAVANLYHMHVTEEAQARDGLLAQLQELHVDIEQVASVIQVAPKMMPGMQEQDGGPTLMQQLAWLREYKAELEETKNSLIDQALPFLEKLHQVWIELGLSAEDEYTEPCVDGVISEQRVMDCQERLKHFEHEKHVRFTEAETTMEYVRSLMTELEFTPHTKFDTLLRDGDVNDLALDEVSMNALAHRTKELQDMKAARTETLKNLGLKIQPLWTRLKVSQDARRTFFAENSGLSERVIDSCTREYHRLCDLKHEMLASLVDDARVRITQLWESVRAGPTERAGFEQSMNASGDEMSDELLTKHDEEIASLSKRFAVLEPILGYVNKYLTLCEERTSYDVLIQDSSRLLSRQRGAAKSEADMRKRVESDLPNVIKKLKSSVTAYEGSNGPFLYEDQHFLTYLSEAEAEYITQKKEQRDAKLKAKREKKDEDLLSSQGGGARHPRATPSKSKARGGGGGGRSGARAPLGRNNTGVAKTDGQRTNVGEN